MKEMKETELEKLVNKIKSMSGKEIILTMIDALRYPVTEIDMQTYGVRDDDGIFGRKGVCYGCAATNLICKLGNFDPFDVLDNFENREYRDISIASTHSEVALKRVISKFESAINELRIGNIRGYNKEAIKGGFAVITESENSLPVLTSNFTDGELREYEQFANTL